VQHEGQPVADDDEGRRGDRLAHSDGEARDLLLSPVSLSH
jgi:hypothetical protein